MTCQDSASIRCTRWMVPRGVFSFPWQEYLLAIRNLLRSCRRGRAVRSGTAQGRASMGISARPDFASCLISSANCRARRGVTLDRRDKGLFQQMMIGSSRLEEDPCRSGRPRPAQEFGQSHPVIEGLGVPLSRWRWMTSVFSQTSLPLAKFISPYIPMLSCPLGYLCRRHEKAGAQTAERPSLLRPIPRRYPAWHSCRRRPEQAALPCRNLRVDSRPGFFCAQEAAPVAH